MKERPREAIERAVLVGLASGPVTRAEAEHRLEELAGLATAARATVVFRLVQERLRPDPATLLGSGRIDALAALCAELQVDVVIVDNELSPAQAKNLAKILPCRVVDRTQVILDIFASRARTREGKLQVELAQLEYLMPRLVGAGAALSRLGGGIGTRGPGETQLETDRRRLRGRIRALSLDLQAVRQRRGQLRERRKRSAVPTVALVGYTNAGKTTLFNRLTREQAVASNALFVTLDPLTREAWLADGVSVLVSDTVGFIERLPHSLVAAFRATLEEVSTADVLLHVADASSPDLERHLAAVERVLEEVDAVSVPRRLVLNKMDLVAEDAASHLGRRYPDAIMVSAQSERGLDVLRAAIVDAVGLGLRRVRLELTDDARGRDVLASLHRFGRVHRQVYERGIVAVEAEVPGRLAARLIGQSSARVRRSKRHQPSERHA